MLIMTDFVRGWKLLKLPIPSTQAVTGDWLASCVPFYWLIIDVAIVVVVTVILTLLIIKYLF
jgi:hypothetical protein